MEYKQNKYGKVKKARRKARPRPYTQNRLDQVGNLSQSVRKTDVPMVIEPWMPVFPARIVRRLRYNDTVAVSSTTGAVGTYVLRANDLYDPDFTGTGHQPLGFDQLMLFYNHFTVTKAKLVCTFESTTACPVHVSLRVDGDSTAITTPSRLIELGGNVLLGLEQKAVSGSTRTAEIQADIGRLQGVSQGAITSDPSLQGSSGASPVECSYFHISVWNDNSVSGSVNCQFILEQEAVFMEPRDLTQS